MGYISRLKPDTATTVGLATAAGVYAIYSNSLPSITDIRVSAPHDEDVETLRKHAAWESAALIGLVFLIARDLNSYIISAAALFGIDYLYKHHNAVNPTTGKLDVEVPAQPVAVPSYEDAA